MNRSLILAGLSGNFQNWTYFQVLIKVKDLVMDFGTIDNPNFRIKTTDEVEVIYSKKGIGNLLQRALDGKRIEPIKKFINEQPDAYINNLTVAIFEGNPEWIPFDISSTSFDGIDNNTNISREELIKAFGIIKLTGDETLFVLDGQHRLKALREAYKTNKNIGENDISLTLIAYKDDEEGRKKTRRLFSIINRYAKPVSLGENILLDEDDMSAIITRRLVEDYSEFKDKDLIALNKTADLKLPKDKFKFSTAICLWSINELIIDPKLVYPKYIGSKNNLVRIRPNDEVIESYNELIFGFWDLFFQCLPKAKMFVESPSENLRGPGGPFSLRPIGQQLFCDFYLKLKELNRLSETHIISNVPDDLTNEFWHFVLYNPIQETIMRNRSYARDYLFYMLGLPITSTNKNRLLENYRKFKQNTDIELPRPLDLT